MINVYKINITKSHNILMPFFILCLETHNNQTIGIEGQILTIIFELPGGVGGGDAWCTRVQRGPHLRFVFRGRRGLFLRPHVREFVKEGYFFVPRYEV